jgi:phage-related protein
MPEIGAHCHELHIADEGATRRIIYRLDDVAVVIVDVFSKKTLQTPGQVIVNCRPAASV